MTEFKVGDRVRGPIYGYTRLIENYASGKIQSIDSVGDPTIVIDVIAPTNQGRWKIGDEVYLQGRHTRQATIPNPFETTPVPDRAKVLREAEHLITGERNVTYGEPTQNFEGIAKVWTVYLGSKLREGAEISAADTAWMMIGLKMVRSIASPSRDNWVDAAGYAGCGAECDLAEGAIDG
jgi:hypothetical protein